MIEVLLEKRRKKINNEKLMRRCRKMVFLLVFFLTFFGYPNFIDTEIMGGSIGSTVLQMEQDLQVNSVTQNNPDAGDVQEAQDTQAVSDTQATPKPQAVQATDATQDEKVVYLTFDDGPTAFLPGILDILAKYDAQATFFLLEPLMIEQVGVLGKMQEEGHAFGLHGVSHNRNYFYASEESVVGEMNQAQATLQEILDIETVLVRVPYGSKPNMTPAYIEAMETSGFKMWDWNVDSKDWFYRDERVVEYTLAQIKALEQSKTVPVVLLHDRQETELYLPQILDYLHSNNYIFRVLSAELEPVQLK